jgi:hypothetical protein
LPSIVFAANDRWPGRVRYAADKHPELAFKAQAAGMKTLGELEIFPSKTNSVRLPLCAGQTMLLDKPLGLIFSKRRKRNVPNVAAYISWIIASHKRPAIII